MSDRNLSRHPILLAIYDASQAIERCGASPELTHAAVLTAALSEHAAALLDERDALQEKIDLLCAPVSPSNLRDLGAFLANLLDEDRWPAAERRLNAALSERASLIAERDDLAHDVKRHLAIVASVEAERDAAIRRAGALRAAISEYLACEALMRRDGCPNERWQAAIAAINTAHEWEAPYPRRTPTNTPDPRKE